MRVKKSVRNVQYCVREGRTKDSLEKRKKRSCDEVQKLLFLAGRRWFLVLFTRRANWRKGIKFLKTVRE